MGSPYPGVNAANAGSVEIGGGGYLAPMAHDDYESTVEHAVERPKVQEAPPPGPADHGRHGGMATRENAPELAEGDDRQD